jgi:hypothetical protein
MLNREPKHLRKTREALKLLEKGTNLNGTFWKGSWVEVVVTAPRREVQVVSQRGPKVLQTIKAAIDAEDKYEVSEVGEAISIQPLSLLNITLR